MGEDRQKLIQELEEKKRILEEIKKRKEEEENPPKTLTLKLKR